MPTCIVVTRNINITAAHEVKLMSTLSVMPLLIDFFLAFNIIYGFLATFDGISKLVFLGCEHSKTFCFGSPPFAKEPGIAPKILRFKPSLFHMEQNIQKVDLPLFKDAMVALIYANVWDETSSQVPM